MSSKLLPAPLVVALALAHASAAGAAKPRPNVILICADDLNVDLGCYGHPLVKSPAIDRLAARGTRFERAYCQYPVCNPSRTSFLSGRRPSTTRIIDNVTPPRTHQPGVVFLPQHFRQSGYRTIKVGKIFHTGERFEDPASWDIDVREDRSAKSPPDEQLVGRRGRGGMVLDAADDATWDGFVARQATELLAGAAGGKQPFFLAIGFRRPHSPYIAPRRYHELYPATVIPPIDEPADHVRGIPRVALTYELGGERLDTAERAETAAAYYASVTFMDEQLGHVLDEIDRRALWDNTVVVFMSDHGYHLGEHGGLWHKMTLFEESARVPLVIAAPGLLPATCPRVVELIDLYPTLCELCGLALPVGLEGASVAGWLSDPARPRDRGALTVVSHANWGAGEPLDPQKLGRSLRTDRWRYTEWFDGSRELYDHDADPHEYRNLAGDAEWEEKTAELSARIKEIESRATNGI
ncbi:MAG: sulfatase [Pirellulales bacterium]|nr:sulfatase [Pirellulales bacterium]